MTLESVIRGMQVIGEAPKYDLYHKDFSSAMQHAYKMAKKLHGITIDPKEIDDKVATGPRKPSEGKTNKYRLKGDKGGIQIQVYNKGGSKPFELNMYKEEVEIEEAFSVEVPKQSIGGKTYGGGASVIVKAKSASHAIKMVAKRLKVDWTALKTGEIVKEDVDLDEGKMKDLLVKAQELMGPSKNRKEGIQMVAKGLKVSEKEATKLVDAVLKMNEGLGVAEEADLDEIMEMNFDEIIEQILAEEDKIEEGKMKELHALIAKGMSAEDIAKKMKLDVKTIKSLMSSKDHKEEEGEDAKAKKDDPKKTGKEKVDVNPKLTEAKRSAAQQARRDAGSTFKDKDDEEDDIATDADKKRGDLNIIMQLRKAADNPKHKVKFADGKAVAIKPGIVKTALQIFGKLKSNDKQKIQPQMAKSYKDMVKTLQGLMKKAGYHENLEENWTMERMGLSPNLVDAVKDIIMGKQPVQEKSGDAAAYKKFFDAALKKFKVGSPAELEGEQKKKFYDYIDKNWESDAEKAGKDEEVKVEEAKVEEEMTKAQEEKREEIVKELKKKTEDFKEKYGDRWETVMYATATKLAMKK